MPAPIYTGNDLISWGYKPGPHFPTLLKQANKMGEYQAGIDAIKGALNKIVAKAPVVKERIELRDVEDAPLYTSFIDSVGGDDAIIANVNAVYGHMDVIMRLPPVVSAAIMPDACPAGSQLGTIPVGGVVGTTNAIFPGMHSADVCCSMMASYFPHAIGPKFILDAAQSITHFGPGGRDQWGKMDQFDVEELLLPLLVKFPGNQFLKDLESTAIRHFMTQGDGNHFLSVGISKKQNQPVLVTHHGSRGFGAQIFKRGLKVAKRMTKEIANVPDHMSWIVADSDEGKQYWEALQIAREWTKLNHYGLHAATAGVLGISNPSEALWTIWNEHNFVFKRDDVFYHAKGATPSYQGFSEDDKGFSIIPMNMGKPILITRHLDNVEALGFAPHGAGRNQSRTGYLKTIPVEDRDDKYLSETEGLDVRWYTGKPDLTECGSAYKDADMIRRVIDRSGLADVVDEIKPYGCIMAGEIPPLYKKKVQG